MVPARHGRGVVLGKGESLAVTTVAGGQVGDLFAFSADDPSEYLSAAHTRASTRRLFPARGEAFTTSRRRPILTLVDDTSPGVHDFLIAACDPERYALLGADPGHRSCAGNLRETALGLGFEPVVVPQPVNLFMNTPPLPDGRIDYRTSPARPGDRVVLRAEMDAVVIVSSCPMDLIAISDGELSDLVLEMAS